MGERKGWLLPLEPIGIGTALVESLSGYVLRLAWHHFLAPSRMTRYVLAEALGRPDVVGLRRDDWGKHFSSMFRRPAASLNGRDVYAREWVTALEQLTGLRDLDWLTCLRWQPALPSLRLLSATRRYCPACLASMPILYEPLLWQVQSVRSCGVHQSALLEGCTRCGASRPILTSWGRPGWCMDCTSPLKAKSRRDIPSAERAWQRFATEQVGLLLAGDAPTWTPGPPPVFESIRAAIGDLDGGNITRFAARVRLHLSTVSLWQNARRMPNLDSSLRIAYVAGFNLPDLLSGTATQVRRPRVRGVPPSQETRHPVDWEIARERLITAIAEDPPPPLHAVADALGVDRRDLKRHWPDEYRALVAAHRSWRQETSGAKRQAMKTGLLDAIDQVHARGQRPSRRLVSRLAEVDVDFRDHQLVTLWRDRLAELGWYPARR